MWKPKRKNKETVRPQIEKALVVSMARSHEDRYLPMVERMTASGFSYPHEKIEAIDGKTLTEESYPQSLGANTWACVLSHIKAIKRAQELNLDMVLILEDDVDFVPDFTSRLNEYVAKAPLGWEALWLGGRNAVKMQLDSPNWYRVWGSWGTFGYILRKGLYQRTITGLLQREKAADYYFKEQHRYMRCYRPRENLIGHLDGYSYIAEQELRRGLTLSTPM